MYSIVKRITENGLSCKKGEKRLGELVKLNIREKFNNYVMHFNVAEIPQCSPSMR